MTTNQEDALYEFLESRIEPFTPEDAATYIRKQSGSRTGRLAAEIATLLEYRNIAFQMEGRKWLTRRGCFQNAVFAVTPSRLELLNGILIPGHRCLPFANPMLLPKDYLFFWDDMCIGATRMEGAPEEFYPYYTLYGEEYAPQYIVRDNPENEAAFNDDPYEDPPEVSIQTLDMREVYRKSGFVPGDRFRVSIIDWKDGHFLIERVAQEEWPAEALQEWADTAERGFSESFERLGPGGSTDEQITYAYWYGGERMRLTPAYALEELLYRKTDRIETASYGIETRFWYAGKEIPDRREIEKSSVIPDRTMVEDILLKKKIPISEFVVNAYIRDALFRRDADFSPIIERVVPHSIDISDAEWEFLAAYIAKALTQIQEEYTDFSDKRMGPVRQRIGELHTAVIDLTARLRQGSLDSSWLPKHTFIILSQIQNHAANVLEDLDTNEVMPEHDLEILDNSVDSMIDTYEDIKEMINEAIDAFRRNNLSIVKPRSDAAEQGRIVQISIGGTDIWRRVVVPETCRLEKLHRIIQRTFGWSGAAGFRFSADIPLHTKEKPKREVVISISKFRNKPEGTTKTERDLTTRLPLSDLGMQGVGELSYEYGAVWSLKLILLARLELDRDTPVCCLAGAGAAPPENIDGPVALRRYLSFLERGTPLEQQEARKVLGASFNAELFDLDGCNRRLKDFLESQDKGLGEEAEQDE
ncbi:MAG: plasmid pRiA4b ORF-3 family protein [Spirochaetaceae bacterium]|jgi:hypothetical protein|nr:plasmid pRiA4b ORF-3 family protein [Spirochaetaceae bacterium]